MQENPNNQKAQDCVSGEVRKLPRGKCSPPGRIADWGVEWKKRINSVQERAEALRIAFIGFTTAAVVSGCEIAYKQQVRDFISKNISECGGTIESLALVQDGANKLTGLAEVKVDDEKYKTAITVKTGIKDAIITMEDDVCAMHSVRTGIKALQNLFN